MAVCWLCVLFGDTHPRLTHYQYIGDTVRQKTLQDTHNCLCHECLTFVMATVIPQFELFNIHANDAIAQWRWKWIKWLENLFVAAAISDKKRQRPLLLCYAREEVSEIFDTLPDTGEDFETAKTKLNMYFDPKKNVEFEIFTFRQVKQNPGETTNSYHSCLITTVGNYLWIHWNCILMRMWDILPIT